MTPEAILHILLEVLSVYVCVYIHVIHVKNYLYIYIYMNMHIILERNGVIPPYFHTCKIPLLSSIMSANYIWLKMRKGALPLPHGVFVWWLFLGNFFIDSTSYQPYRLWLLTPKTSHFTHKGSVAKPPIHVWFAFSLRGGRRCDANIARVSESQCSDPLSVPVYFGSHLAILKAVWRLKSRSLQRLRFS